MNLLHAIGKGPPCFCTEVHDIYFRIWVNGRPSPQLLIGEALEGQQAATSDIYRARLDVFITLKSDFGFIFMYVNILPPILILSFMLI